MQDIAEDHMRVSCWRPSRRAWRILPAAILLGPGCGAKVLKFDLVPNHVCAGTPVKLDMQVVGTPTVSTSPPLPQQPGLVYVPTTTTRFVLSVRRWPRKPIGSETEVKVMPGSPAEADEITANVTCSGDRLSGTVDRSPSAWDPRLKVTTVESGEEGEVLVSHEGRSARLTPASPTTDAFAGTSPGGAWTVSSTLPPGQRCDDHPPDILNIAAQVRCGS